MHGGEHTLRDGLQVILAVPETWHVLSYAHSAF